MRPQTTIALVVGAVIGIGVTWFALVRETTAIVTEPAPPARVRPEGTQFKETISGSKNLRPEIADANPTDVEHGNDGSTNSSSVPGHLAGSHQSGDSFQQNQSFANSSPVLRNTTVEDQIIDPGEDDSYSMYRRVQSLVIRTDYSAANLRLQSITYLVGSTGKLLSYELLGGDRNKLYRATLGYSQREGITFGKLVVEKIFDVHELRYLDELSESGSREERPIYQFAYSYNADGSANEPVGISMMKAVQGDALFDFGGVKHMVIDYGKITPHIVSALNQSYPIEPLIKP